MQESRFECEKVIKYLTSLSIVNLWEPTALLNAAHIQHSYNYKQPYSLHLSTAISKPTQCFDTNCDGPRFNYTNHFLIHFQGSDYHIITIFVWNFGSNSPEMITFPNTTCNIYFVLNSLHGSVAIQYQTPTQLSIIFRLDIVYLIWNKYIHHTFGFFRVLHYH